MAKLSKFVKNNLFTEVGGFILDARQAKVLYDLINQITGGGSYLMVGEIAVTNISDLNAPEFLLKEPGNYGLNITDGFEGHQNMNLNIAFNSTSTSGSIGLQDILQTIRVGEKVYTRTLVHTQMGENISLSYGEWADSTLPSNRFVTLQEKSFVQPHTIGQLAEGGIIFYILQDGDVGYDPTKQKGLVVSPNQSELAWNNEEYVLTGANKTILGYGKPNTDKIVAAQVGTIYNYPARKCTQLNLGGHVDWYLPDMDELLKLYSNSLEAGIDDLPFGMWSSTEYDLSYAILIYNDQEYNTVEKNQQYPFRAIRSYEINLSEKVEVDDEIMVSTGVEKEIRGSGKKLKDILNIIENPEKIVKSLTTVDLNSLNRVDLTSGQYSLTGGLVGSLIVTNEIEDDILIGVLQELNDGDVIKVREIATIPNVAYGDWVTKSITEEQKTNSHEPHSDDQDLSGLVEKVEGEGLLPTTEREKLAQLDPLPSIPIGQVRKDDGKFHNITHQQVTELNTDPGFQHIDSTTERATIIDADALVIWNSITGKSEVTTYSHFKANLANTFVVKDIGNAGSATKLQTARSINGVAFDGTQGITINAVDITPRIATSLMGIANGVATLGNDTKVPLSQIPVSLLGQVNYKGMWDASTGSPSLPATPTANGDYYIVSVAGNTPMGTVSEWKVGDWLISNGTTWGKVDNTDAVSSVNGHTGVVVLSKSDVGLSNVVNALQWHDGNHPSTVSGYGLPTYPTTLPASDVYAWAKAASKPSYAYSEITGKPTYLSQFNNDLGNYGGWITGINSGMVTTALGYTPWHSGDHPTTISGYGITDIPTYSGSNFILNQNASAQPANMWISGQARIGGNLADNQLQIGSTGRYTTISLQNSNNVKSQIYYDNALSELNIVGLNGAGLSINNIGAATFASTVSATQLQSTVATGTAPLTVNSTTMVGNLNAQYLGFSDNRDIVDIPNSYTFPMLTTEFKSNSVNGLNDGGGYNGVITYRKYGSDSDWSGGLAYQLGFTDNGNMWLRSGMSTGWSTWNKLYHSGNLTNTLTTNSIPKWNGSSMVNSLISDDGSHIGIRTTAPESGWSDINDILAVGTSGYARIYMGSKDATQAFLQSRDLSVNRDLLLSASKFVFQGTSSDVSIASTTHSTAPTNGALVVGGGIGVGGMISINGNGGNGIIISRSGYHTYNTGIDDKGYYVYDVTRADYSTVIAGNGNMSIGYANDQGYKLAVNGTGFFNGVVTGTTFQNSDRRLKAEIKSVVGNYEIETMQFEYKDNIGVTRYGYIAQDIQKILPNLVHERPDGMLTVNITDVHSLEIHQLKNRIKILEEKLYGRS